jgi:hypothetical protein
MGMLRSQRAVAVRGTGDAGWVLGLVALVLVIGGCADNNSASSRIDRVDTADGIEVTITRCEAEALPPTDDGWAIPQTAYTVEGTVENTSGEPRLGVEVHVTFLDGDDEFYGTDVDDLLPFGGIADQAQTFSESVTLSDEVTDLQCEGTATS